MTKRDAILILCVVMSASAQVGCDLFGETEAGRDARIDFGRSISGVEIGMDTSAVTKRLGRPDFVRLGDFTGVIFTYAYPVEDGAGYLDSLSVAINTNPMDSSYGVIGVEAKGPYSGRSAEGIGIGSTRKDALDAWGSPDDSHMNGVSGHRDDVYEFAENRFRIYYEEGKIASITLLTQPRHNDIR